jgi:very-short-patch-repair endonuclease
MSGAEEQDKIRQEYIESFGIQFLRFTNEVCQTVYNRIEEIKIVGTTYVLKNRTSAKRFH